MNIDFYWVLFFIVLFVFAAIGFGLSALFPADHPTRRSQTRHHHSRH